MTTVTRLLCIALNTRDPAALARFYVDALGFSIIESGAPCHRLQLADTVLELRATAANAASYPADVAGWSPYFQHCAMTVSDMDAAFRRLSGVAGWTSITRGGPQTLPPSSGSVIAFKFRDPEGHPLELLYAPGKAGKKDRASPFLRIDHSAISVADIPRSIAFYESLGLRVEARSVNHGAEQERLDDVVEPVVDVVTLAFAGGMKPHVELLAYRGDHDRPDTPLSADSIAATTLVFATSDPRASTLDPDGHHLEFSSAVR